MKKPPEGIRLDQLPARHLPCAADALTATAQLAYGVGQVGEQ
jgi:hypothetical protein